MLTDFAPVQCASILKPSNQIVTFFYNDVVNSSYTTLRGQTVILSDTIQVAGYPMNGLVTRDPLVAIRTEFTSTVSTEFTSIVNTEATSTSLSSKPTNSTNPSSMKSHARISPNVVAAISSSVIIFAILLFLTIYLLWRRRYTTKACPHELPNSTKPQDEELDGQPRSEMEDATRPRRVGSVIVLGLQPVEMSG